MSEFTSVIASDEQLSPNPFKRISVISAHVANAESLRPTANEVEATIRYHEWRELDPANRSPGSSPLLIELPVPHCAISAEEETPTS